MCFYTFSLCLTLSVLQSSGQISRTFFGDENYIAYPAWNAAPQRLLRFTFQTSELNGLLVYAGAPGDQVAEDHLLVRLVNGSLSLELRLRSDTLQRKTLGEFLNDNQPHTLTIYHNPAFTLFEYLLDSGPVTEEPYASGLMPRLGSAGVFIGGVPLNSSPFGNETNFVGCIEDVLFASTDISGTGIESGALQTIDPTETVGQIQDGCADPCSARSCSSGLCVSRWPNLAFCDCRGTMMLGEDCSEDPTAHQLTFEPENFEPNDDSPTHYCYRPQLEPYTSQSNSFSIQLLPPIPQEGTLLVAHPEDGRNSFSLRIQDGRIVYKYETTDNETRTLTLNTLLDSSNTTYQIDLNTASNGADVILSSVSDSVISETERMVTGNANMLYPSSTIFSTVCLGGSLLEYKNYVGTIQNAFYGYNSLLEERNFCQLGTQGVSRSDLIVFADTDVPRSLPITRFGLNSHMISFEFRYRSDEGAVMVVENTEYQFYIAPITGGNLFFVINPVDFFPGCCPGITITDREWHFLELSPIAGTSLVIRLDGSHCCTLDNASVAAALASLANDTLQFGATHSSVNNLETDLPQLFSGCMRGIELRETEDSEVFRPNLEAVPRVDANFDTGSCNHCLGKARLCTGGQVCTDGGQGVESVCTCPDGFSGFMCEEPLEGLNLENLSPNLTCIVPPLPTPSQSTTTITSGQTTPTDPSEPDTTTPAETITTEQVTPTNDTPPPEVVSTPLPEVVSTPLLSNEEWAAVGAVIGAVLLLIIAILIIACVLYRRGASIRGFYRTNESTGAEASMLRYSASLRQLSSEIVDFSISKDKTDVSWTQKNGDLKNGAPPSMSINRTPTYAEKEYVL